ncbi:MAG: 30S ribosomal protein S8 [Brevinematia bacterium]
MDVIADTLVRIKNALKRKFSSVDVRQSTLIKNLLEIMKREGYIEDFSTSSENKYFFTVKLKYYNGKPVISGLKRISKLGKRVYVSFKNITSVYNNLGIAIISTSKGVMTDREARELGVGGEVICYVW